MTLEERRFLDAHPEMTTEQFRQGVDDALEGRKPAFEFDAGLEGIVAAMRGQVTKLQKQQTAILKAQWLREAGAKIRTSVAATPSARPRRNSGRTPRGGGQGARRGDRRGIGRSGKRLPGGPTVEAKGKVFEGVEEKLAEEATALAERFSLAETFASNIGKRLTRSYAVYGSESEREEHLERLHSTGLWTSSRSACGLSLSSPR